MVSVLALVILFAAVQIQVRAVEEPYLLATHSISYLDYASRAGRFVPRIGRLTRPDPHNASYRQRPSGARL